MQVEKNKKRDAQQILGRRLLPPIVRAAAVITAMAATIANITAATSTAKNGTCAGSGDIPI